MSRWIWIPAIGLSLVYVQDAQTAHTVVKNLATGYDDFLQRKMTTGTRDRDFILMDYDGPVPWPSFRPGANPTTVRSSNLIPASYIQDNISSLSAWVVPPLSPDYDAPLSGFYAFQTVFDLGQIDPTTVRIDGFRYAVDNQLTGISINSRDVFTPRLDPQAGDFLEWHYIGEMGRLLFEPGMNVIEFRIHNELRAGTGASAFRFEGAVVSGPNGDFDGDGEFTGQDIDLLSAAVRSGEHDPGFDLNGDGVVIDEDRDIWVERIARTYYGDANLDGVFDSGDLVAVFVAGEYEDGTSQNSTWATGDWSGDLEFTTRDLIVAYTTGAYEYGPREAIRVVPEPTSLAMLVTGLIGIAIRRRNACRRSLGRS